MQKIMGFTLPAAVAIAAGILATSPTPAAACTSESYIGTICVTAANFCPEGFLAADGAVLPVNTNQALFSLLGFTYGGNGSTTFALPDLRGRATIGTGQGTGLTQYVTLGQKRGAETTQLSVNNLAAHNHAATYTPGGSGGITATLQATGNNTAAAATVPSTTNAFLAGVKSDNPDATNMWAPSLTNPVTVGGLTINSTGSGTVTVASTGGSQPIGILPPELGLTTCIVSYGIYPTRP